MEHLLLQPLLAHHRTQLRLHTVHPWAPDSPPCFSQTQTPQPNSPCRPPTVILLRSRSCCSPSFTKHRPISLAPSSTCMHLIFCPINVAERRSQPFATSIIGSISPLGLRTSKLHPLPLRLPPPVLRQIPSAMATKVQASMLHPPPLRLPPPAVAYPLSTSFLFFMQGRETENRNLSPWSSITHKGVARNLSFVERKRDREKSDQPTSAPYFSDTQQYLTQR